MLIDVGLESRLVGHDTRVHCIELLAVGLREVAAQHDRLMLLPDSVAIVRAPRLARVEEVDLRSTASRALRNVRCNRWRVSRAARLRSLLDLCSGIEDDRDFSADRGLDVVVELGSDPEDVETDGGGGARKHAVWEREHARFVLREVGVRYAVDFAFS